MKFSLVLLSLSLLVGGCIFDGGSASILNGPVNQSLECTAAPRVDGCPACSTPEGTQCRDQWYSTALRCTSDAQCGGSGACHAGFCVGSDRDGDGIDDDFERELAELNFPQLWMAEGEDCGSPHGVVYRVRRHPTNAQRFAITYVVLYANDCGELGTGHIGDAETFSITVDPSAEPGAAATVGVEAWAHYGTSCGSTSSCATATATNACGSGGARVSSSEVVIYASREKHATYLSTDTCDQNCFDTCSAGTRIVGPLLNTGEPGHPLVTDLTTQGFVQAADGWDKQLLHFDPWGSVEFGGGGRLDQPLSDRVAPAGQ